jgi:hypothetical protein
MTNIVITYPRRFFKDKTYRSSYPSKWAEVTEMQMIAIGKLISGEISEINYLKCFLNLPVRILKRLSEFQKYKLNNISSFIAEQEPLDNFIIKTINNKTAPLPRFENVSFAEFIYIDTFFIDYCKDSKREDLLKMIACIYVDNKDGVRPKFTGRLNSAWTDKLPSYYLESTLVNYSLIRAWLQIAFPFVFKAAKKTEEKKLIKGDNGWLDVFDSIVGDDIIHSDDYAHKSAIDTLRFLNRKIKENSKPKRKKS